MESKYKMITEQLRLMHSDEEVGNYLSWIIESDAAKEYWENNSLNQDVVSRCNFFKGDRELWEEHHREESVRLQNLLISKGFTSCSIGEAEGLWMSYSDGYAAGFLGMPDSDEELYECIKDQLCVIERHYIG